MKDGFYKVKFNVPSGDHGGGIVTVRDNVINGGDDGYLYKGKITPAGDQMTANLNIKRHDPSAQSVFGNVDTFTLPLTGQFTTNGFSASGKPNGLNATIAITGTWIADLAS